MLVYNKREYKNLRRNLRNSQTLAERKVWGVLKCKKLLGLRFLRQFGVENYILDFYCPKLKLAIEIDGGQHNDEQVKLSDSDRSRLLSFYGITVVRFWNNEAMVNLQGVYQRTSEIAKTLMPTPPSLPFRKGEESRPVQCIDISSASVIIPLIE